MMSGDIKAVKINLRDIRAQNSKRSNWKVSKFIKYQLDYIDIDIDKAHEIITLLLQLEAKRQ